MFKAKEARFVPKQSSVEIVEFPIVDQRQICTRYINEKGLCSFVRFFYFIFSHFFIICVSLGEFDVNIVLSSAFWSTGSFLGSSTLDFPCVVPCLCDTLFSNKELDNIMRSKSFDLAIVDLKGNDCGIRWLSFYNIPLGN